MKEVEMPSFRMAVKKYIPHKLYGFVSSSQGDGFFHLGVFHCPFASYNEAPVPPIVGEEVDVSFEGEGPEDTRDGNRAPRVSRVERVSPPRCVSGKVDMFQVDRGYGFVKGEDGDSYYLHRSEVNGGRIPMEGDVVVFYAGYSRGRPRACHVDTEAP